MNAELLERAGIDYRAGLERFMDDAELYKAVLTAFAQEDVLERAQAAFAAGDMTLLLRAVHEAKGSSGNAGLNRIYNEASALVTLLRSDSYSASELNKAFHNFEEAYQSLRAGIREALATEGQR